jgi:ribonucleoside-diphosphate reductase alpha chain
MSVTYNIPENATPETVESIYVEGWRKGVKSIAVYRDKSRMGVIEFEPPPIVEKRFSPETDNGNPKTIEIHKAPKRKQLLPCDIFHVKVQTKKFIVIVGILNGHPYEVFAGEQKEIEIPSSIKFGVVERSGSRRYNLYCSEKPQTEWKEDLELDGVLKIRNIIKQFDNEAYADTTRLVSTCLRHGVPISTIIDQLDKTESVITSFGKALMRVLKVFLTESVPAGICSECGGPTVRESGCIRCLDCNLSKC